MRSALAILFLSLLAAAVVQASLNVFTQEDNVASAPLPSNGAAVDEVVVESSLYIKSKPNAKARKTRSVPAAQALNSLVEHKRVKRITALADAPRLGLRADLNGSKLLQALSR